MTGFDNPLAKLEFEKVLQRVVRYASSGPGADRVRALTVFVETGKVKEELSRVTEMKRLLEEEDGLPLHGIQPIAGVLSKTAVEGAVLLPAELLAVSTTAHASRTVRSFLARRRDGAPQLWEIADPLSSDKVLEYNITQAIDDAGSVRSSASRELAALRRATSEKYEHLRTVLEKILHSVSDRGFSQEDLITTREGRMVIPVKVEHKQRVPGFIHSASASGATVFIEPAETLELNNEIRSLQFLEQREVDRILRSLTAQVALARQSLLLSLDLLAELDCLQARARYSIECLGIEPEIGDSGSLVLVEARHPLLLAHHGRQGTVPLDLSLVENATTLVISGPNAGGKSVALKCAGLLTAMAQAGLHIPAGDGSRIRVVRSMYVDIGDDQSIESDLSTFSSHLRNLKEIADGADRDTLVLIDEIGTGTDPAEGGAIAAALLDYLTRLGAMTIATTHHSGLKVFAHETEGVVNGAMEFDRSTLEPTYRFRPGVPGSSYALDMASRLGFPRELMLRAREILGTDQSRLERLLVELEGSSQQYRSELQGLRQERSRLDSVMQSYEEKMKGAGKEARDIRQRAADEARTIVSRANAEIERSVREIKESSADAGVVRDARRRTEDIRRDVAAMEEAAADEQPPVSPALFRVGSAVVLADGDEAGEIIAMSDDGQTSLVVFGNLKVRVPLGDLKPATRATRSKPASFAPAELPEPPERVLDLRGKTGEEAFPLIDKFFDTATLGGLNRVDLIHGKGTGALRKKVTEYLTRHPRVQSFRLGEWNEGGTGVTVVELGDM